MLKLSNKQQSELLSAIQAFKQSPQGYDFLFSQTKNILEQIYTDGIVTNLSLMPELKKAVNICAKFEHNSIQEWITLNTKLKMYNPRERATSFSMLKLQFEQAKKTGFAIDKNFELFSTLERVSAFICTLPEEHYADVFLSRIKKGAKFDDGGFPLPTRPSMLMFCVECARLQKNPMQKLPLAHKNYLAKVVGAETGLTVSEWMKEIVTPFANGEPKDLSYMLSNRAAVRKKLAEISDDGALAKKLVAGVAKFEHIPSTIATRAIPPLAKSDLAMAKAQKPTCYKTHEEAMFCNHLSALNQDDFDIDINYILEQERLQEDYKDPKHATPLNLNQNNLEKAIQKRKEAYALFDLVFFFGDTFDFEHQKSDKNTIYSGILKCLTKENCLKILETRENKEFVAQKQEIFALGARKMQKKGAKSIKDFMQSQHRLIKTILDAMGGQPLEHVSDIGTGNMSSIASHLRQNAEIYAQIGVHYPKDFAIKVAGAKITGEQKVSPRVAYKNQLKSFAIARTILSNGKDNKFLELGKELKSLSENGILSKSIHDLSNSLYRRLALDIKTHKQEYALLGILNPEDFSRKVCNLTYQSDIDTKKALCNEVKLLASDNGELEQGISSLNNNLYHRIQYEIKKHKEYYNNIGVFSVNDFIQKVVKIKVPERPLPPYRAKPTEETFVKKLRILAPHDKLENTLSGINKSLYGQIAKFLRENKAHYTALGVSNVNDFVEKIALISFPKSKHSHPPIKNTKEMLVQRVLAYCNEKRELPKKLDQIDHSLYGAIHRLIANDTYFEARGITKVADFVKYYAKAKEPKNKKPIKKTSTFEQTKQKLVLAVQEFANQNNGSCDAISTKAPKIYRNLRFHMKTHAAKYAEIGVTSKQDYIVKVAGIKEPHGTRPTFEKSKEEMKAAVLSLADGGKLPRALSSMDKILNNRILYQIRTHRKKYNEMGIFSSSDFVEIICGIQWPHKEKVIKVASPKTTRASLVSDVLKLQSQGNPFPLSQTSPALYAKIANHIKTHPKEYGDLEKKTVNGFIAEVVQLQVPKTRKEPKATKRLTFEQKEAKFVDFVKSFATDNTLTKSISKEDLKGYTNLKYFIKQNAEKYAPLGVKTPLSFATKIAGLTIKKQERPKKAPKEKPQITSSEQKYVQKIQAMAVDGKLPKRLFTINASLASCLNTYVKSHKDHYTSLGVLSVNDFIEKIAKVKLPAKDIATGYKKRKATVTNRTQALLVYQLTQLAKECGVDVCNHLAKNDPMLYARIHSHITHSQEIYDAIDVHSVVDFITKVAKLPIECQKQSKKDELEEIRTEKKKIRTEIAILTQEIAQTKQELGINIPSQPEPTNNIPEQISTKSPSSFTITNPQNNKE